MIQSLNFFLGDGEPQQVFEQGDAREQLGGEWEQRHTHWKAIVIKLMRHAHGLD